MRSHSMAAVSQPDTSHVSASQNISLAEALGFPLLTAAVTGAKPAVLAIVIVAAWRLGRRILQTPLLVGLAYPLVVIGAALLGLLSGRLRPQSLAA